MRRAVTSGAGLAVAAILAGSAPPPAYSDIYTCTNSQWSHVVTLAGTQTTSSMTPVDLPGAAFSFTPANRCLVVEVSGQVRAVGPNAMRLQVVVNGAVLTPPFPAFRDVYTPTTAYDARTVTFAVDMDEGDKDVKVQFMSVNGGPVSLNKAVIVFRYTPGV